jgi:hypothetical protein
MHCRSFPTLKDRLEAGEISTNEYNELCAKLSDNFKLLTNGSDKAKTLKSN